MQKIFVCCVLGMLTVGPALASDKSDVMAVIHKWGSAGPNDVVSTCAAEASVLDDVPPYEWHGSGACSKWLNDFNAFTKQNGVSDAHAVISKARRIDIAADHAYVIAPITFHYKMGGKDVREQATGTFALQKGESGWRVTGWAYSPR